MEYPAYEHLRTEVIGRVGRITLNRPEKLNALSRALLAELIDTLRIMELDDDVRTIVLRGAGRAFSAGYDLTPGGQDRSKFQTYVSKGPGEWPRSLINTYTTIWDLYKPVIAQIHGYCLAGATELVAFCDLVFTSEDCQIGYPAVRALSSVDIIYHPWLMPMRKAAELLMTGDSMDGNEAVRVGYANFAFPTDELDERTLAYAERMSNIAPDLQAINKRGLHRVYEVMGFKAALLVGADMQALSSFRESAGEFTKIANEQGLKAALDWRDGPFRDYRTKGGGSG